MRPFPFMVYFNSCFFHLEVNLLVEMLLIYMYTHYYEIGHPQNFYWFCVVSAIVTFLYETFSLYGLFNSCFFHLEVNLLVEML